MNNSHGTNPPSQNDLSIGSMVEVLSKNAKPRYGVIRWLGILPNSPKMCAGLELVSYAYFVQQSSNSIFTVVIV